ncbi:MAG: hypothetical protein ACQES4_06650 [Bacillota bacterium]
MEQEKANELKERILFEAQAQKLPCKEAFIIASEVGVPPSAVGKTCNEMGVKIVGCQLGCF